jgi:hypothetical protein
VGIPILGQVQYLGKATKVGTWFATGKREKYCLAKILGGIANILVPNQLHAKSFEVAHVLARQKLASNNQALIPRGGS